MMPTRTTASAGILTFALLLMVACSSDDPTLTPTIPAPDTPTATLAATPTSIPSPTSPATVGPTSTTEPTPTSTPTSTPEPTTTATSEPTATATIVPAPTPTPVLAPLPTGESGGQLTTLALVNIEHRDVHQEVQETLTSLGPGLAYSRLLRLRTGPEEDYPQPSLLLECDLCESWEALDALTYSFKLREGVLWHQVPPINGRELVAEDVAFSLNRLRTPGWPNAALLQNIDQITAEDRYTVNITLNPGFPDADFMVSLADGHAKVVAPDLVKLRGDLKTSVVIGTGPWQWVSTERDRGTEFVRNPTYFEEGLPFANELSIRVVKGTEITRLAAFGTDPAINVYRVPPGFQQILDDAQVPFNSFLSKRGGSGIVLTMNTSVPPFDNLQVRRAVLLALDPWNDLDVIWSGQGFVSLGIPVKTPQWLLSRSEMRGPYFADQSGARDLLNSLETDALLNFDLDVADFGDIYVEYGQQIASDLRSVGFETDSEPRFLNPTEYQDTVWDRGDYQIAIGQLPPTTTTNSYLLSILHSSSPTNVVRHSDSILDGLIVDQAAEMDLAVRRELIRQIQLRILDQAYMVSTVTDGDVWVFDPVVKGLYPNSAASEYFFWAKAWIDD